MGDFDWKNAVTTIAPSLATALAPELGLAGVAIRAIGQAFGMQDATEQQVSEAIAKATPADLLAMRNADQQFQKDMASIGVDLEKIAAEQPVGLTVTSNTLICHKIMYNYACYSIG